MKKYIISILLVLVIILTMTACVKTDTQAETEATESTTVVTEPETEATEATEETEQLVDPYIAEYKIAYLSDEEVMAMSSEDVSDFFTTMVALSETRKLSDREMTIIGGNLFTIWYVNTSYNRDEFDVQASRVFDLVYEQAINSQIPLESIYAWGSLPVPEILVKYLSSENFTIPENARCFAIEYLGEKDLTTVVNAFFANPVMKTNTLIPSLLIQKNCKKSITDRAWAHLEALSKSTNPRSSEFSYFLTRQFCESLLANADYVRDIDKISAIAENILDNDYYDIVGKYVYLCYAFYDYQRETYFDSTISDMAFEHLYELAQNADEETVPQLQELATFLQETEANKLLDILG